eukprot:1368839-Pleurochrysis_carterae.AAC.10
MQSTKILSAQIGQPSGPADEPGKTEEQAPGGRPDGCVPSSPLGLATGGASRWAGEHSDQPGGRQEKNVSSKYTSVVLTTLCEAGIQML